MPAKPMVDAKGEAQLPPSTDPADSFDPSSSMEELLRSISAQLGQEEEPPPPPFVERNDRQAPVAKPPQAAERAAEPMRDRSAPAAEPASNGGKDEPVGSMEDLLRSIAAQLEEEPTAATEDGPPVQAKPEAPAAKVAQPDAPAAKAAQPDAPASGRARPASAPEAAPAAKPAVARDLRIPTELRPEEGDDGAQDKPDESGGPVAPTHADGLLARESRRDPVAGSGERDLLRPETVARPHRQGLGNAAPPAARQTPPGLDEDDDPAAVAEAMRLADERRQGAGDRRSGETDPARVPPTGDRRTADDSQDRRQQRAEGEPERGPGWEIKPSAGTTDDPLLGCLTILCALLDRPLSAEALTSGLPLVEGRLSTELFPRAAARAGISARLVSRSLSSITRIALPCVLLLKGRRACVLTEIRTGQGGRVVLPEMGAGEREVGWQELLDEYVGYAIFARPEFQYDNRSEERRVADPKGWFWGTIMSSWKLYIEVGVAAFLINAFAIASPLFTMNVYDRVVPNFAEETLWVLATGIAIIYGFDFLLKFARTKLVDAAGKRADTRIAARLFQQVLGMKMGARPHSAGSLANTMREFDNLREFFTSSTLVTLVDLPFLFLFLGVIFLIGGPLAIVPLAAVVLVVPVVFLIQMRLQAVVSETFREAQQKHAILVEAISGVETVKSTASEGRMQRNWETFVGKTSMSAQKAHFWSQAAILFSGWATQMVTVGIIVYGVYMIANGDLSMGALVACNMLAGRAMAPLGQVAGIIIRFNQSRASLKALDEMMRTPVERPEGRKFITRSNLAGSVEFKNVAFTYPQAQTAALVNASFKIEAGEKVGVIGRIGSGKSTLERLLLGLYEPTEGAVLVDGIDTRQLDPADLRRSIGVVPQDVYLFFGSVRENIALAAPYADDAAILRAARIAGVDEFVSRHPQGFDLPVGERGMNLSGGQRQAISVARALLLDPPILLLDEPTSSMDNTTESRFKARLGTVLGGRTLILITHRGSLLSLVDRLIVMDGGKVVADGPKEDVLEALAGGRIHTAKD